MYFHKGLSGRTRIAAGASFAEAVTAKSDEARSAAVEEAARGVRAMVERGPERVATARGARRARPWLDAGTKAAAEAAMQAQRKSVGILVIFLPTHRAGPPQSHGKEKKGPKKVIGDWTDGPTAVRSFL